MSKLSILLARQRSGTGALGNVLDQQPKVKYLGEVFHDQRLNEDVNFFNFMMKKVADSPNQALPSNRSQQLKDFFSFVQEIHPGKERIIIDVKYRSLHHINGFWHGPREMPTFIRMSREMGLSIIHLTRRNFIKTYVSGLLAEMNKVWHATSAAEIKVNTIKVDTGRLLNYLNATRNEVEFVTGFLRNYSNVLQLEYEDIFDDRGFIKSEHEEKIAGFCGLSEFLRIAPPFIKQTSNQLQDVIENYQDVADTLKDTMYSWMLE